MGLEHSDSRGRVSCRIPYVAVHTLHLGFDRCGQGLQVVLVGHVRGVDWIKDTQSCVTREEDQRARLGYLVGTFDDNGKYGELRIYRDAKGSLVKWQERALGAAGSLGKHDQGVPACSCNAYSFVDRPPGGASLRPIDLDDADCPHGVPYQGDLEELHLGEEPAMKWNVSEKEWNVEHREMVGDNDIALVRIDLLDTKDLDANRGNTQPQPGPVSQDPVVDWSSWAEGTVDDDEGCKHEREKKKQRNEHKRPDRCKQSAEHGS